MVLYMISVVAFASAAITVISFLSTEIHERNPSYYKVGFMSLGPRGSVHDFSRLISSRLLSEFK